jgi:hypothetical protein
MKVITLLLDTAKTINLLHRTKQKAQAVRCSIDVAVGLSRTAFAPNCSRDHQQSFPDTGVALPEYWSTLVCHHLLCCITYRDLSRIDNKTTRNVVKNGSSESALSFGSCG